jgi:hypothetical protein
MGSPAQTRALNAALLIAGLASAVLIYQYASNSKVRVAKLRKDTDDEEEEECLQPSKDTVLSTPKSSRKDSSEKTPLTSNTSGKGSAVLVDDVDEEENEEEDDAVKLHTQIEEIDKRGKVLFKSKKFLAAAEVFTEAIDLIHSKVTDVAKNSNLKRQMVTLMNNRSAMYEKGDLPDLALVGE